MVAVQHRFNVFCSEIFRQVWPTLTFSRYKWWVGRMKTSKLKSFCRQENEAGAGAIEARFLQRQVLLSESVSWTNWEIIEIIEIYNWNNWNNWILLSSVPSLFSLPAACVWLRFGACRSMSRAAASLWARDHFLCRCSDGDTFRISPNRFVRQRVCKVSLWLLLLSNVWFVKTIPSTRKQ